MTDIGGWKLLSQCDCGRWADGSEIENYGRCQYCRQNEAKIERLAEYAHQSWCSWMEYLFSKCIPYDPDEIQAEDGDMIIPKWAVKRWARQMRTAYKNLPEKERWSDRREADKIISVLVNGDKLLDDYAEAKREDENAS